MPSEATISEPSKINRINDLGTSSRPDDEQIQEVSLLDLLIVLAEQKIVIFAITAIFAISAALISLVLPKEYTATVTLLPPQQGSSMAASLLSQIGGLGGVATLAGGGLGLKNPNDIYVAILKSRTLEDKMIQRFGLMKAYRTKYLSDARKRLEGQVKIDGSAKDGLIHISVEDRDSSRAAELANGYVDEFRHVSSGLAITEASQRRLFFEQQLEHAKEDLAKAENAMIQTQQKTGLILLPTQEGALIQAAVSLRAQITAKEVDIQSLRTYATNQNAQIVQAEQELESLRAQLAKLGGSESGADGGMLLPKGRVPEAGLEYLRRERDVKYQETLFQILARQFEVAKLDEAKQGALIQVLDAAVPPDRRSSPKRALIVTIASVAGLFLGLIAGAVLGGFRRLDPDSETRHKISLLRSRLFSSR